MHSDFRVLWIVVLLFCNPLFSVQAQDIQKPNAVKSEFSNKAIAVYQEESFHKIEQFYHYLELFSTAKPDLKHQLKLSIRTLFKNQKTSILDFTQAEPTTVRLENFLSNLSKTQKLQFSIEKQKSFAVERNYWMNEYNLNVKIDKVEQHFSVIQKVYFEKRNKTFGQLEKEVWGLKLGNIKTLLKPEKK